MSVVSFDCGYCGTGYRGLIGVDAGKIADTRGEQPPHPACRVSARSHVGPRGGRLVAVMRRVVNACVNRLAAGGKGTA